MVKNTATQSDTKKDEEMIDLVCGMRLSKDNGAVYAQEKDKKFYFCSDSCKKRFEKNPQKFQGTPLIRLENLRKVFKMGDTETIVLGGISINIWEGDFVALIGASGSGKSTSLNMMGLLDKPTSGNIFLRGQNISFLSDEDKAGLRSRFFGFIFQQYHLIPWLSAYDNIVLPLIFSNKNIDHQKISENIEKAGLSKRVKHHPFELSGGEQQRTALLRSLVNDPEIILGDEPTGNLDSQTGNKILEMLVNLNKKDGKTLVIVTHDADIAEMADQVITLKDGIVIKDHQLQKKIYTE